MDRLKGKTAVVTGGTTGIGRATAERYAAEGARVYATGRNPETLEAARAELNGDIEVVASDAGDEQQIRELFDGFAARGEKIDVLFLNAGVGKIGPLGEASLDDFDTMWQVNVRGPWLAINAALPVLADGASIIINTSVANAQGMPGLSAYTATKAAARGLVRVAAAELAPRGIRVNAISPGPVETPLFGKLGIPAEQLGEATEQFVSMVPLGRAAQPDEVASAALFIGSDEASYVTGTELPVDGGMAQV